VEAVYARLLARDQSIVAAAALLWRLGSPLSAQAGAVGDLAGLVAGAALGACALPLHEWGHLLGAVLGRSRIRPSPGLRSPFVFSFDSRANSQRQFLAMSFGGWLGTAAAVCVAYGLLPSELLASRVARGMVGLSVLLVLATEVPLLARALWTGRIPPIETVRPERAGA
jgi:hypothetical protein